VHDEVDYLADALGQLSHKRRRAVFLRFYCGRTVPEISQLTGEPIGTVKSLLHRSLIELRAALA
jgi:DNA-directed RNA polymerase specialized sigma24 family protein